MKKKNWFATLLSYAKGSGLLMWISVILSIISILAGLGPYYCVYRMIEEYINGIAVTDNIIHWGIMACIFYLIKIVCFGLSTGVSHYVAYNVLEGMRLKIADIFLKAPLGEVYGHSIGEIKGVIVDKIEEIEPPLAHMIPEGSGHLLLPVISFIALCFIDFRVALASLVSLPIGFVFMCMTFVISGKNMTKYQEANTFMNSVIVEYIEGIEVIKAFGRAGTSYEKYSSAIDEYRSFIIEWLKGTCVTMKLSFAFFPATLLGVVPVSIVLVNNGTITVSQMALAVMLAMSMLTSFARLEVFSESIRQMQYMVSEVEKLFEISKLPEPEGKAELNGYEVKLNDVRFSYGKESEEVIHGINMELKEGSYTALVGPSGSGKSTVARLIARFWDITGGNIEIGGVDIRKIPVTQLADMVSFVTQDNFLFQCSILENIRLGNPKASDEEVRKAAKDACCDEFILKLPDGYNTLAGEAGKKLSGGEKQRIAIARMMLKNAPIVILDEATAFTDPENEYKLQISIERLTKGKTLLVIAHRLSTIKNADNIIVLNNGKIEAEGRQDELLQSCSLYKRMWEAHLGAKNWAAGSKGGDKIV